MKRYYLNTEMTSFTRDEEIVAWFPRSSVILQVNSEGLETLHELAGEGVAATGDNLAFLDGLAEFELIDPEKKKAPVPAERPTVPGTFDSLSLFLTEECNLACRYCYANGGTGGRVMSREMMRRAVTWMADYCKQADKDEMHLAFHGAGEPTLARELLFEAVALAEELCSKAGMEPFFSIGTNGVMDEETRAFLIEHNFDMSLSIDGPEDYHNSIRPGTAGSSFSEAFRTAEAFSAAELPFSVRTTVTEANLPLLPDFVEFICENTCCEIIQLEPVYLQGRGADLGNQTPDPDHFVDVFLHSMDLADEFGVTVSYSGISWPAPRETFCQACGSSICVTPDGSLTGCYESAGITHDDPFHFGMFWNTGEISIDEEARRRIMAMDRRDDICFTCPALDHCAGDCPSKMTGRGNERDYRCTINRKLLRGLILHSIDTRGSGWIDFN